MTDNIENAIKAIQSQIDAEWEGMMDSLRERDTFQIEEGIRKIESLETIMTNLKEWQ